MDPRGNWLGNNSAPNNNGAEYMTGFRKLFSAINYRIFQYRILSAAIIKISIYEQI